MSPNLCRTLSATLRIALFATVCSFTNFAQVQVPITPPANNLALWVRADAGVTADASGAVSLWEDQSPNGFDATQTDPAAMPVLVTNAVNAKPVLRFDGGADFLDVASAAGLDIIGDIASFAVIRVDDYVNYNAIWGKTAANFPAPNDWYLIAGNGIPQ